MTTQKWRMGLAVPLLVFLMALLFAVPVLAADLPLVTDDAYLLTDSEYEELNALADSISEEYGCEVAIVTVEDMGGDTAEAYAQWIYNEYNFGYGDDKSGMLLLLSMVDRDYALIAYGYGNTALTDHGREVLLDEHVLPLLGDDEYYAAFEVYLNTAAEYLAMARDGAPFDVDTDPDSGLPFVAKLGITILVPLLIAGALCMMWRAQMKTARAARAADSYIPEGGFVLTAQEDQFLYRTETRRKIEKKSSGGTRVGSDGFSGSSGKF